MTIALSGSAPATGSNTPTGATSSVASVPMKHPANAIYDFIPATGAKVTASDFSREVVSIANCEACHRQLGGIPGLSEAEAAAGFHGGSRNETQYCVVCHTDQRRYGQTEATFTSNGAIRTFTSETRLVDGRDGRQLAELHPQDPHGAVPGPRELRLRRRRCRRTPRIRRTSATARRATTARARSRARPRPRTATTGRRSRAALACGACHDGINFATATGLTLKDKAAGLTQSNINGTGLAHPAGPLPDDSQCALCHKSNGTFPAADIDLAHFPVTPPNPDNALAVAGGSSNTNSAWIASGGSVGRLPPGAITPTYEVQSVSRNASKQPVMVFRWLQNGTAVPINDFATAAVNPATGQKEMWDNFMGSPSAYFVFAVPQDGIAAPADFNATVSRLPAQDLGRHGDRHGAGTLTGPDGSGFYTVTLTGVTIPDNAVMLTGGMGYSYSNTSTLPLTQTNLPDFPVSDPVAGQTNKKGGLIVIAPNVQMVATGYTGRRAIVEDKRCNACHQELGTFTEGRVPCRAAQRRHDLLVVPHPEPDQQRLVGRLHLLRARDPRRRRSVRSPTTGTRSSATEGYFEIRYPGILNDCQTCHLPGTFDFSATARARRSAADRSVRWVRAPTAPRSAFRRTSRWGRTTAAGSPSTRPPASPPRRHPRPS